MPEVVRGIRNSIDAPRASTSARVHFGPETPTDQNTPQQVLTPTTSPGPAHIGIDRNDSDNPRALQRRSSMKYGERDEAEAYYDSRAATKREFKRRASTLQEYYRQNPALLPQLPFTWRHGWKRWKLFAYIGLIFVDACAVPLILYYTMRYVGNVQGWIIFAVVATIWGGPTYVEFAVRSWRLIKKEDFFRPLGTKNRWAFDYVHYLSSFAIAAVTAFLIVGSAPHIVWLRILSLPGPALLLVLSTGILWITIFHVCGWKAPFRLSSSAKGESVKPGVFYIVEDVVAVNAGAGRPYREALNARYEASPMFRRMMLDLSWAWSIPSLAISIVLFVLICIHPIDKEVAYGIGWGVPFLWMAIWGVLTVPYVKWCRRREREAWENDTMIDAEKKLAEIESAPPSEVDNNHMNQTTTSTTTQSAPTQDAADSSTSKKAPTDGEATNTQVTPNESSEVPDNDPTKKVSSPT